VEATGAELNRSSERREGWSSGGSEQRQWARSSRARVELDRSSKGRGGARAGVIGRHGALGLRRSAGGSCGAKLNKSLEERDARSPGANGGRQPPLEHEVRKGRVRAGAGEQSSSIAEAELECELGAARVEPGSVAWERGS